MDEIQFPSEGSSKRSKRMSVTSYNSIADNARSRTPVLRKRNSIQSIMSYDGSEPDRGAEIHSPVPRRDHLHSSETRGWLNSPSSSRAVSPLSPRHLKHELSHRAFSSIGSISEHDGLLRHAHSQALGVDENGKAKAEGEDNMGKRWLKWMHKQGMKEWVLPCTILASMWVKWCIGLGSYSGQGTPPMFGDYEAQRHWMEITIHLPIRQWYTYDLRYWGLDYPPLTAYVSWLCGVVGSWINPSWFALDKSRGIETAESKTFMRASVLTFDTLIYVPAVVIFTRTWLSDRSRRTQNLAVLTMLLQPALLLIDFGHFQYNGVMLGFTLLAVDFFAKGQDLLGAFFFVLSLGFKQMALYYAPAIGSYLIGKCIFLGPADGMRLFVRLAIVTSLSFVLLFLPFLPPFAHRSAILDPITRIFPFNRGLFEDKVANFWCATNVLIKWRTWSSSDHLVKLSAGLTALGFLPGAVILILGGIKTQVKAEDRSKSTINHHTTPTPSPTPILSLLPYALLTTSISFFLFSFQVHEKTILLPLLPITLILCGAAPDSAIFEWGVLVNNVAVFSMWALLKKDGLGPQYIAVTVLWNRLIGSKPFRFRTNSFVQLLSSFTHVACLALHLLELLITPPRRYPDLFPVLNVLVSTPVFFLAWLWSIKCGVQALWALGGLVSSSVRDRRLSALSTRSEQMISASGTDGSGSIGRDSGLRVKSLGFAQGRRPVSRTGSVGSLRH